MQKITILIVWALLCLNFPAFPRPPANGGARHSAASGLSTNILLTAVHSTARPATPLLIAVTDTLGKPLPGAKIRSLNRNLTLIAGKDGNCAFPDPQTGERLEVSYIGHEPQVITYSGQPALTIVLKAAHLAVEEVRVVSTGYQELPRERATGSFVKIDQAQFNRNTAPTVLERLNGMVSGLQFNNQAITNIATGPQVSTLGINIRGASTLSSSVSKDPLIVVDNFPYEGNLSNLNPNDIESVTVLKDAAAASIWGARSGNGVIVITTKRGRPNQPITVEINSNVTLQNKPDLAYDRNYLSTADYIDAETYLFRQGYYNANLSNTTSQPAVSPVVSLLARQRSGQLSEADATAQINALRTVNVRDDFARYFYRRSLRQQYALSLRGGTAQNTYAFSAGYDNNRQSLVRNAFDRITLNAQNVFTPSARLSITAAVNYSANTTVQNNRFQWGSGINVGGAVSGLYPYARLADPEGHALPIVKDYNSDYVQNAASRGLLDWQYRPLDELALADNRTRVNDLLLKAALRYQITSGLHAEAQYQNERQIVTGRNLQDLRSYAVRNLINRFTVVDLITGVPRYPFPAGAILTLTNSDYVAQNGRLQMNFDRLFAGRHQVTAIAGTEIRALRSTGYQRDSYGYNEQFGTAIANLNYADLLPVNPSGTERIPPPSALVSGTENRYVSYYANAGYTYDRRYTLSLSGRKDGSNIFGVKTNERVTPLWSAGLGWNISSESFYEVSWLSYLKARLTYGYNGNVYNGSAFVTGTYTTASLTGLPAIVNLNAPNPYLSWEKVRNINAGLDFTMFKGRVSGTLEWYRKDGTDLIDNIPLFPSSGFTSYTGNAASTTTRGIDLTLTTKNVTGRVVWTTTLLFSTLHDRVTQYNGVFTGTTIRNSAGVPAVGKPLYGMYSYRWAGLDPTNGDPQGYLGGKISKEYSAILNNFNPDSLVYHGSARPTIYGSFRNDISYRQFSLSFNILYQLGYWFRRSSTAINYTTAIGATQNADYAQRWQKAGDERQTSVPSVIYPANDTRNNFYQYAEVLMEKGDNIRLQDLRLSYALTHTRHPRLPFRSVQVYTYLSNLGILWRANKRGLDPDLGLGTHALPNPFTIAIGFNAQF